MWFTQWHHYKPAVLTVIMCALDSKLDRSNNVLFPRSDQIENYIMETDGNCLCFLRVWMLLMPSFFETLYEVLFIWMFHFKLYVRYEFKNGNLDECCDVIQVNPKRGIGRLYYYEAHVVPRFNPLSTHHATIREIHI